MLKHPWFAARHALLELTKTACALHANQIVVADVGGWPVYTRATTWVDKIRYNLMPPLRTPWLHAVVWFDALCTVLLLVFSLIGLLILLGARRLGALHALCVLSAVLLWGLTLAYGCARLRLPFEPIMMLLGAYGVYQTCQWLGGKKPVA